MLQIFYFFPILIMHKNFDRVEDNRVVFVLTHLLLCTSAKHDAIATPRFCNHPFPIIQKRKQKL